MGLPQGLGFLTGLACTFLCAGAGASDAVSTRLPEPVQRVVNSLNLPEDGISIVVHKVGAPRASVAINAQKPRNPASTMKLLTTWLALEELGPAYSWPTHVYSIGPVSDGVLEGDLLLKGFGDPYMTTERLWSIQRRLRLLGVQHVQGDLVIDKSYFADEYGDPGEFDGEGLRVYNTFPSAVLVNFQAVQFSFLPDTEEGVVRISADPMPTNLEIVNKLRLRPRRCGGFRNGVRFELDDTGERDRLTISGNYGQMCDLYSQTRSVLQPETFTYGVFRSLWEESGGTIGGGLRVDEHALDDWPEEIPPLIEVSSPPLSDVIKYVNKYSNNVMSRQLFLTLGAEALGPPATIEKARAAAFAALKDRGVSAQGLVLDNGSGLSRTARITGDTMADLLLRAARSPWWAEFVSSLSLPGMDGTLRKRFVDEATTGNMHLKTGRLKSVFATAGYVHAQSGEDYVVVILLNFPLADKGYGEEVQGALLRWVYEQ